MNDSITLGGSCQHFGSERSRNLVTQPGKLRGILAILPVGFGLHFIGFLTVFDANFGLQTINSRLTCLSLRPVTGKRARIDESL